MSTNSPHSAAPVPDEERQLRSGEGLHRRHAHGKLHADAGGQPQHSGEVGQGTDRICQGHPGKLSFASGNTSGVVAGETLKHWAELDMLHVPYKSSPPAINDVLGGRVSMMFTDLITGLPHVKAGKLNALAVSRIKRSALIPELPTLDEAGVTGFDMDSWAGHLRPGPHAPGRRQAAQHRAAQDHRQPRRQVETRQCRLRGVLKLARGAGRLRERAACQVGQDGQGRRHPAGMKYALVVAAVRT